MSNKMSPPAGLKVWLSKYQGWTPAQRLRALDSLIEICDLNQVRYFFCRFLILVIMIS